MTTLKQHKPINYTIQSCGRETFKIPLPYKNNIVKDCYDNEQPCLLDAFFKHQQTLPPSQRSTGALISCPCPRCNPARL